MSAEAHQTHPLLTVGGLLVGPSGQLLLIRSPKWSGEWGIPAGKVEVGEALEDALRREIREEVGLEVVSAEFLLVQELLFEPSFHLPMHFVSVNYACRVDDTTVVAGEEVEQAVWVEMGEAMRYPLNLPTAKLLDVWRERGFGATP